MKRPKLVKIQHKDNKYIVSMRDIGHAQTATIVKNGQPYIRIQLEKDMDCPISLEEFVKGEIQRGGMR